MRKLFPAGIALGFFCLPLFGAEPQKNSKPNPPSGFMDIQFGSSKEDALKYFIEKYHMKKDGYGNSYSGDNYFSINEYDTFLNSPSFCIAGTCYDLVLWFGKIDKFQSYIIKTKGTSVAEYETTLQSEALTLSQIFEEKFGAPKTKNSPEFFNVKQGYDAYFWKWDIPGYNVYTALDVYEFKYRANATVTNKALESQETALQEKEKNEKIKSEAIKF